MSGNKNEANSSQRGEKTSRNTLICMNFVVKEEDDQINQNLAVKENQTTTKQNDHKSDKIHTHQASMQLASDCLSSYPEDKSKNEFQNYENTNNVNLVSFFLHSYLIKHFLCYRELHHQNVAAYPKKLRAL